MKNFKQIDLRSEKKWIWSYSLIMMGLSLFILAKPVYAGSDRVQLTDQRGVWFHPSVEHTDSNILINDSLALDAFKKRYDQYHRAHMLLFREYFGPAWFCRFENSVKGYPAK